MSDQIDGALGHMVSQSQHVSTEQNPVDSLEHKAKSADRASGGSAFDQFGQVDSSHRVTGANAAQDTNSIAAQNISTHNITGSAEASSAQFITDIAEQKSVGILSELRGLLENAEQRKDNDEHKR